MKTQITRLAALLVLVVTMSTDGAVYPMQPRTTDGDGVLCTTFMQAVRIRKLHLVRPDLIPYPVYYETLC